MDQDDSDPSAQTIDKSGFGASLTLSATMNVVWSETLVTLADGRPGRTTTVSMNSSRGGSFTVSGGYQLAESSGDLAEDPDDLGSSFGDPGDTDFVNDRADAISQTLDGPPVNPTGSGTKLFAAASFALNGRLKK